MTSRLTRSLKLTVTVLAAIGAYGCAPQARQTLRVATINVAHGRGVSTNPIGQIRRSRQTIEENLKAIAACLKREAPDVVALQEADTASDWSGGFDHVAFLADVAGYPYHHHGLHVDFDRAGMKLRYGTALLACRRLANAKTFTFGASLADPCKGFVVAETEFAGRPVLVVSMHLHLKSAAARRKQARVLIEQLQCRQRPEQADSGNAGDEGKPEAAANSTPHRQALIVMGDFNSTWDRADDAVRQIAQELNLRPFEPENDKWNTYPSFDPRLRLDWILISRELQFRDQWCWRDKVSDHLGVTAELVWR